MEMRLSSWHWAAAIVLLLGGRAAMGHSAGGSGGSLARGSSSPPADELRSSDTDRSFQGFNCGTAYLPRAASPDDPANNKDQQPGVVPYPLAFRLAPGETRRVALFCTDLFARTPNDQTRLDTAGDGGLARRADGSALKLRDALADHSLQIRGRGPADPPRPHDQASYDAFVTNRSDQILSVDLPAGLVVVPAGQRTPRLPDGFARILAAAASSPGANVETLACAVWAARGFTRADVEQTLLRRVTDAEALLVQRWLDFAFLPRSFDCGAESYDQLYRQLVRRLGRALPFRGTAALATGDRVQVEGLAVRDGRALVSIQSTQSSGRWQYRARIAAQQPGKIALTLRQLRTGLPLEANGGRIWVTLTPSASG
jgi:hypothetical protein